MEDASTIYLAKAQESLAGAESELANERFNNCANRCYYAAFQAAIAALIRAGVAQEGTDWKHTFVQSQFVEQLINRRKLYPARVRDTLMRNMELRHTADYQRERVSSKQAGRALERTRAFLEAIVSQGGETR